MNLRHNVFDEGVDKSSYRIGLGFGAAMMAGIYVLTGSLVDWRQVKEYESTNFHEVVSNKCFADGTTDGQQIMVYESTDGTRHTYRLQHCVIASERERLNLQPYEAKAV